MVVGGAVVKAGSAVADFIGQSKQSAATRRAALAAERQEIGQVNLRQSQEQQSARLSIMEADRQARAADAAARVSAGEAGVQGASVDAVLGDIARQDAEYRTQTNINLQNTLDQLDQQRKAIQTNAHNIIAQNPAPSGLGLGLNLFGAGLDAAGVLIRRNNPTPKP
jgi:hypothetical protein